MKNVDCPEHGETVLRLARGLLDPRAGGSAELIRAGCEHCSAWWAAELDGQNLPEVAASVEQTISEFLPPQRQKKAHRDYLVAAATVALAAGILIFASNAPVSREGGDIADKPVSSLAGPSTAQPVDPDLIVVEGFESATEFQAIDDSVLILVQGSAAPDDSHTAASPQLSDVLSRIDFEDGSSKDWSNRS